MVVDLNCLDAPLKRKNRRALSAVHQRISAEAKFTAGEPPQKTKNKIALD